MSAPKSALLGKRSVPLTRVVVERRVFVGYDKEVFINEWLKSFVEAYSRGRIEGYVLDLSGGRLWAALDLSDVPDEVYKDIALRAVEPDDAKASEAFLRLTRACDPATAVNKLTRTFDTEKWPSLAKNCSLFTHRKPSLDSIGKWLKAEANRLKTDRNRRVPEFRSRIKKIMKAFPEHASWNEDFMRQADRNVWPSWAVECVPSLYVPLASLPNGGKHALVWRYILSCVPEYEPYRYEVTAALCDGQISEIRMTAKTAGFLESIAHVFEEGLRSNPYQSDRSRIGEITFAMSQVELRFPEAAQRSMETRQEILIEEKVIAVGA